MHSKLVSRSLFFLLLLLASAARAEAPPELRCSPEVLRGAAELVLVLPEPHGRELAVLSPSGVFFFLAFSPAVGLPDRESVPGFEAAKVVTVNTGTLEGWRGGVAEAPAWARVFVEPGEYEFRTAATVQTDVEGEPVASCRVRFEVQ